MLVKDNWLAENTKGPIHKSVADKIKILWETVGYRHQDSRYDVND
jgi:hypothetical protein